MKLPISTYLPLLCSIFLRCQAEKGGKDVFSDSYLRKYCKLAQEQVADTELDAVVQIYSDLISFVNSFALPYVGADTLPLTVTQYAGVSASLGYPTTVMCKMKSWDAIQALFSVDSAEQGSDCSDVNIKVARDVIGQIKKDNPKADILQLSSIKFDLWTANTGPQWTNQSPSVTAYVDSNGDLHIVGKELYVSHDNPVTFVPNFRKGVNYCQTIAPVYLRDILLGVVQAPTCSAPPTYSALPSATIPDWSCGS